MKIKIVFQTLGPCDVKDIDLAGHERQVYLCKHTQDEDFSLVTQSSCINIIDKFELRKKERKQKKENYENKDSKKERRTKKE